MSGDSGEEGERCQGRAELVWEGLGGRFFGARAPWLVHRGRIVRFSVQPPRLSSIRQPHQGHQACRPTPKKKLPTLGDRDLSTKLTVNGGYTMRALPGSFAPPPQGLPPGCGPAPPRSSAHRWPPMCNAAGC
ncbi:unnamed protein product, partial [Prorocentrum cordatum]